jgi:hypothetical protein
LLQLGGDRLQFFQREEEQLVGVDAFLSGTLDPLQEQLDLMLQQGDLMRLLLERFGELLDGCLVLRFGCLVLRFDCLVLRFGCLVLRFDFRKPRFESSVFSLQLRRVHAHVIRRAARKTIAVKKKIIDDAIKTTPSTCRAQSTSQ